MKILIAVDGSEYSQEAINTIPKVFNPETAEIKVLYVLAPISISAPPQMARGYAPEMAEVEKQLPFDLNDSVQKLRTAGFTANAVVEIGEVRTTILDFADSWEANMVVVGSHGRHGILRLLLGSVAESVVRHAPCSVLVVRRQRG